MKVTQRFDETAARKTRMLLTLTVVAVLMFGFAFALVPLYDTLCRALGINGRIEQAEADASEGRASGRTGEIIRVEMLTSGADKLAWSFYPLERTLSVRPGEMSEVQFHARNNSGRAMTVRAIPSVTPTEGASYLVKTDCFCFVGQTLKAGESIDMPVRFYVDANLPEKYRTLTLSYALFDVEHE